MIKLFPYIKSKAFALMGGQRAMGLTYNLRTNKQKLCMKSLLEDLLFSFKESEGQTN